MGKVGWGLWVVTEWICPSQTDRKGVKERVRISECYGESTGFVERRPCSNVSITWRCHLTSVSSFTALHYK